MGASPYSIGRCIVVHRGLSEHELEGAAREIVIRNAPSTEDVLQALRDSSVAADETTYWEKASFDGVPSSFLGQVVGRLLDHGRIWTAIAVLADAIERTDLETDCDFASVARPSSSPPSMVL